MRRTRTAETVPLEKIDSPPGQIVVDGMLKQKEESGPRKQIKRKKKQGITELNIEKEKKKRKTTFVISDEETYSENHSLRDSAEFNLSFSDFEREFEQFEYHNETDMDMQTR
ncbi:hypothetical protein JTB14_019684 [Gonioctena quinquepunctata]|nr:hypothetical protein JTB14_019684 [Gonioctena quinquepunctata]